MPSYMLFAIAGLAAVAAIATLVIAGLRQHRKAKAKQGTVLYVETYTAE